MTDEDTIAMSRRRNYGDLPQPPAKKELFKKDVLANRWFYLVIAALIIAAWFFRWDVNTQHRGDGVGPAYVLDRWTGALYFATSQRIREIKDAPSQ